MHIRPIEHVVIQVQEKLKKYIRGDVSLAEELISDRRSEARCEHGDGAPEKT